MIIETLRDTLASVIEATGVPVNQSEAESGVYPFVTYEMTVNPLRTKDGVYGYLGTSIIHIVSNDFDEADAVREAVEEAIEAAMVTEKYSARETSIDKDCLDGIWTIELNYTLKQLS